MQALNQVRLNADAIASGTNHRHFNNRSIY